MGVAGKPQMTPGPLGLPDGTQGTRQETPPLVWLLDRHPHPPGVVSPDETRSFPRRALQVKAGAGGE